MSTVHFTSELMAYFQPGYSPETAYEVELSDEQATAAVEELCARYSDALGDIAQGIVETAHEDARDESRIDDYDYARADR